MTNNNVTRRNTKCHTSTLVNNDETEISDEAQPGLEESITRKQILEYADGHKLADALDSLLRRFKLGELANEALIAYHTCRIHAYDNKMERCLRHSKNQPWSDQNHDNVAVRCRKKIDSKLRDKSTDIDVQLAIDLHKEHTECSQYHTCKPGYCLRESIVKKKDSETKHRHIVCRHKYPFLNKLCAKCRSPHRNHNTVLCKMHHKELNELKKELAKINTIPEDEEFDLNESQKKRRDYLAKQIQEFSDDVKYGWEVVHEPRVEYTLRYDTNGTFVMASPVVVPRRNNTAINQHNAAETILNEGNTDKQLCLNPGAVAAYLIGYVCKKKVTLKEMTKTVRRVLRSFGDGIRDEESAASFIQRCVSAALAAQIFSTQSAVWALMGLPVIDTNVRFHKVSLDRPMRQLNLRIDNRFISNKALVSLDYKTAYALRHHEFVGMTEAGQPVSPEKLKKMRDSNLNDFVCNYRYSYKHSKRGKTKLYVYPRTKRYRNYSNIDISLKFADRLYPLIHIPKFFPRKNQNPNHPDYSEWCKYALITYKTWTDDPLSLFKDYTDQTSLDEITRIEPHVFIDAWNDFVRTDECGQDVALRIRSYLDENSCEKSGRLSDFVENEMCEDPLLVGLMLGAGLMGTIPEEHSRRILVNPPDWSEQREKIRQNYTTEQIQHAHGFVEKNRREGKSGTRRLKFVDPLPDKNQMDADQRLIWVLAQMVISGDLPKKHGKRLKQLLLQVKGPAGHGKSNIVWSLQNDPKFVKHARYLAPTGCAATNVAGLTCHSGLKLPVGESRAYVLTGDAKHRL